LTFSFLNQKLVLLPLLGQHLSQDLHQKPDLLWLISRNKLEVNNGI
jgi:hypothetical protein